MFDTLMYAKRLEDTGISRIQAEAHVKFIAEIVENDLATKADFRELKHELVQLESRLIIKLGVIMATLLSLTLAIATFIFKTA